MAFSSILGQALVLLASTALATVPIDDSTYGATSLDWYLPLPSPSIRHVHTSSHLILLGDRTIQGVKLDGGAFSYNTTTKTDILCGGVLDRGYRGDVVLTVDGGHLATWQPDGPAVKFIDLPTFSSGSAKGSSRGTSGEAGDSAGDLTKDEGRWKGCEIKAYNVVEGTVSEALVAIVGAHDVVMFHDFKVECHPTAIVASTLTPDFYILSHPMADSHLQIHSFSSTGQPSLITTTIIPSSSAKYTFIDGVVVVSNPLSIIDLASGLVVLVDLKQIDEVVAIVGHAAFVAINADRMTSHHVDFSSFVVAVVASTSKSNLASSLLVVTELPTTPTPHVYLQKSHSDIVATARLYTIMDLQYIELIDTSVIQGCAMTSFAPHITSGFLETAMDGEYYVWSVLGIDGTGGYSSHSVDHDPVVVIDHSTPFVGGEGGHSVGGGHEGFKHHGEGDDLGRDGRHDSTALDDILSGQGHDEL